MSNYNQSHLKSFISSLSLEELSKFRLKKCKCRSRNGSTLAINYCNNYISFFVKYFYKNVVNMVQFLCSKLQNVKCDYRCISTVSKWSKVVFVTFTQHYMQSNVTHVERVERSINSFNFYSCYSYRKGQKQCLSLLHNNVYFLNIQRIFNPKKVLESLDLDLSNHTIQCYVC